MNMETLKFNRSRHGPRKTAPNGSCSRFSPGSTDRTRSIHNELVWLPRSREGLLGAQGTKVCNQRNFEEPLNTYQLDDSSSVLIMNAK